jgi:AcrR family transcriptional regulator
MDGESSGRELNRGAPNASGRKPSRKTELVQERILDEAAKIFARKGYQLAKLTDIAEAVGVHVTALRYHFLTKDDLVEDMMNSLVMYVNARVRESVGSLPPGTPVRARIDAAARAYMSATLQKREYMAAHANVLNQVPPALRRRHFKYLKQNNAFWRDMVGEAIRTGELRSDLNPSVATQVLMGTLIWTREWYKPGKSAPEELADAILEILFSGLAPSDARPVSAGQALRKRRAKTSPASP